jgi:hypothetical protein
MVPTLLPEYFSTAWPRAVGTTARSRVRGGDDAVSCDAIEPFLASIQSIERVSTKDGVTASHQDGVEMSDCLARGDRNKRERAARSHCASDGRVAVTVTHLRYEL